MSSSSWTNGDKVTMMVQTDTSIQDVERVRIPKVDGDVLPDSLKKTLFFVLESAHSRVYESVQSKITKFGIIPRHFAILCVLSEREAINQQDLADAIRVNRNAMVQLIDQLEELNCVTRKTNPQNRREHQILITDEGKKILTKSLPHVRTAQEDATSVLNATERSQLINILSKIAAATLA
jgi:DNA-binding MarR family transcriptional regulator